MLVPFSIIGNKKLARIEGIYRIYRRGNNPAHPVNPVKKIVSNKLS
jgi:hypothetical protein